MTELVVRPSSLTICLTAACVLAQSWQRSLENSVATAARPDTALPCTVPPGGTRHVRGRPFAGSLKSRAPDCSRVSSPRRTCDLETRSPSGNLGYRRLGMPDADGGGARRPGKECAVCGAWFTDRPSAIASRHTCGRRCDAVRKTKGSTTLGKWLEDRIQPEPNSGCWLWIGAPWGGGYGLAAHAALKAARGRKNGVVAHRAVYEFYCGPVASGLVLDHLCRNKGCVNPAHLEPVTQAENMRRGGVAAARAAMQSAKTHCKHGHEFTPENTYRSGRGDRSCLICRREVSLRRSRQRRT